MPLVAGGLDLRAVLRHLAALGKHEVWVEAGAGLFAALHAAQLVQQTLLYIVPRVLGRTAMALYDSENLFQSAAKIEWQTMDDNLMALIDWQEEQCLQA